MATLTELKSEYDRISKLTEVSQDGTGLGLPLTKALVELHGGYLDLQSQIGVGTTVTVRFPAARIVTAGANATYPSKSLVAS